MSQERKLTQAEIEERLARRAKEIQEEIKKLEAASIKTQKTGLLIFNRIGVHGVYRGK